MSDKAYFSDLEFISVIFWHSSIHSIHWGR